MIKNNNLLGSVVFFTLLGSTVLPPICLLKYSLRVSDFIALLLIPVLILMSLKLKKSISFYLFIMMFTSMVLSTLNGYLNLNVYFSGRDLTEILRMLIPLFCLCLVLNANLESAKRNFRLFFIIATPFIIFIGILQFIVPGYISEFLYLYSTDRHIDVMLSSPTPRIFITGSDPNVGAAIVLLFVFYYLSYSYCVSSKKVVVFFILLILMLLLALTGSRTVIISMLLSVSTTILLYRKLKINKKIPIFILLISFMMFAWVYIDYFRIGMQSFFKGENNSWLVRLDIFSHTVDLFKESPFLGWGPSKSIHPTAGDGDYFLVLRRYGIIGLSFLLLIIFRSVFLVLSLLNKKNINIEKKDASFLLTFLMFSFSVMVIMITNSFISGYQISVPYFIMLGLVDNIVYKYKALMNKEGVKKND